MNNSIMKPSFFITGTDTGVGKTEAACVLARSLRAAGYKVGVMKPVETGCVDNKGKLIPTDALRLKEASGSNAGLETINPYRFTLALSPQTAAEHFGATIEFDSIKSCFDELSDQNDVMLVEGAGGLLVPVSDDRTMADLALYLGLPLIVVSANRLGTINRTLLTVHCALSKGLKVAGIIFNNTTSEVSDISREYNRADIERLSPVPVLFEIPLLKKEEAPFQLEEGLLNNVLSRA